MNLAVLVLLAALQDGSDPLPEPVPSERALFEPILPAWIESAPKAFDQARDELRDRFAALPGVHVEIRPLPDYNEEERQVLVEGMKSRLARIGVRGVVAERVAEERVAEIATQAAGENVVAVLPGTTAPDEGGRRLVLSAPLGTPGIRVGCLDGWTACVMLVELARHFQDHPTSHTLVFVACGGEALGHRGAQVFAQAWSEEELASIDAVVHLQGCGSSGLHAWADASDRGALMTALAVANECDTTLELRVFSDLPRPGGMTARMAEHGVPGLFLDGVADEHLLQLRTPVDKPALLDPEEVERTARYVQELVEELDGLGEPVSWSGALARYQLSEEDAGRVLTTVRYRLNGPHGIQELGADGAVSPNELQKARAKVTESPTDPDGRTPPATEGKRADDEKLP